MASTAESASCAVRDAAATKSWGSLTVCVDCRPVTLGVAVLAVRGRSGEVLGLVLGDCPRGRLLAVMPAGSLDIPGEAAPEESEFSLVGEVPRDPPPPGDGCICMSPIVDHDGDR